jgi:hypothetical protein
MGALLLKSAPVSIVFQRLFQYTSLPGNALPRQADNHAVPSSVSGRRSPNILLVQPSQGSKEYNF